MTETDPTDTTVQVAEEQLEVSKREVERGRVIVRTHVRERDEVAQASLRQDDVTVERIPVGRPVTTAPVVREENGVVIVPILEERLVISTELVLVEEVHIRRQERTETTAGRALEAIRGSAGRQ